MFILRIFLISYGSLKSDANSNIDRFWLGLYTLYMNIHNVNNLLLILNRKKQQLIFISVENETVSLLVVASICCFHKNAHLLRKPFFRVLEEIT